MTNNATICTNANHKDIWHINIKYVTKPLIKWRLPTDFGQSAAMTDISPNWRVNRFTGAHIPTSRNNRVINNKTQSKRVPLSAHIKLYECLFWYKNGECLLVWDVNKLYIKILFSNNPDYLFVVPDLVSESIFIVQQCYPDWPWFATLPTETIYELQDSRLQ